MRKGIPATAALVLLLFAAGASAETSFDLLYGVADSDDTEITAHYRPMTLFGAGSRQSSTRRVSFSTSDALALRLRHYTPEAAWLGLALEAGYYQADGEGADVDALPLAGLLLLRWPTYGAPYPYCGIGLGWAAAEVEVDFRPELASPVSGIATGLGPDLRAGFAWKVTALWDVFFEYRYLRIDMEMKDVDDYTALYAEEIEGAEFNLETQFVMGGLSLHF